MPINAQLTFYNRKFSHLRSIELKKFSKPSNNNPYFYLTTKSLLQYVWLVNYVFRSMRR